MLNKLIAAARAFNEDPERIKAEKEKDNQKKQKIIAPFKWTASQQVGGANTPIGRFNSDIDGFRADLQKYGWEYCSGDVETNEGWTRPGKADGVSANLKLIDGVGIFYPFTTSVPGLEANRGYSRFQLFMLHNDLSQKEAVKQICQMGYATPSKADEKLAELSKVIEFQKNSFGNTKSCFDTYVKVLFYLPEFENFFYNELKDRPEFFEEIRVGNVSYKGILNDSAFALIRLFFETELGLYPDDKDLRAAINVVILEKRVNPFMRQIKKFKWDGIQRLKTFLHDAFRLPQNALTEEVFLKVLVACIARNDTDLPVQLQWILVLTGEQECGKSSLWENLMKWIHPDQSPEWYNGSMDIIAFSDPKRRMEESQGAVICSLDDLKNYKKSEAEAFKSALSTPRTVVREAYGHYSKEVIQKFVLVASGNEYEFLKDATGNRRFVVLRIPLAYQECLLYQDNWFNPYVAQQLWAEAFAWFQANYRNEQDLRLSPEAQKIANENADAAFMEDAWTNEVNNFVETQRNGYYSCYFTCHPDDNTQTIKFREHYDNGSFFTTEGVYKYLSGDGDAPIVKMGNLERQRIVAILRRNKGVKEARKKTPSGYQRGYVVLEREYTYKYSQYVTEEDQRRLNNARQFYLKDNTKIGNSEKYRLNSLQNMIPESAQRDLRNNNQIDTIY